MAVLKRDRFTIRKEGEWMWVLRRNGTPRLWHCHWQTLMYFATGDPAYRAWRDKTWQYF